MRETSYKVNQGKGLTPHLQGLEDESLFIIREALSKAENPTLLYSIGKDSAVLLHLAMKAYYPNKPPLGLLHVDTRWKFKEMIEFRTHIANITGLPLVVHTNPDGVAEDINPVKDGSRTHTHIMKTLALKQILDKEKFDVIFIGARRDEEKSRAKERVFSVRNRFHAWDPKNQRPEFGYLYNNRLPQKHSVRVSPLSNWTEFDVWDYIRLENIPVVPLYFAAERPTVIRDNTIIMVDDDRFPVEEGEVKNRMIRFRTLGCYPLTGAFESTAKNVDEIVLEIEASKESERQGRLIDKDARGSMEQKKKEGYF